MDSLHSGIIKLEWFSCEDLGKNYVCKYCGFMADLWITLNNHIWNQHKNIQNNHFKIKTYACRNCDFTSYSIIVFYVHEKKCTDILSKCSENLNVPSINHRMNDEEIECNQCGYKAKTKRCLRRHIKTKHPNADQVYYKCDQCSYKSIQKGNLKSHLAVRHTDPKEIKWFECNLCDYKAKQKGALNRHIAVIHDHENQFHYECSKCPYKTIYKWGLKKHVIGCHTDFEKVKWFQCDKCGYKTKQKSNLKQHVNSKHSRENLVFYGCSQCAFRTKQKSYLKQHVSLKHTHKNHERSQCTNKTVPKCTPKRHFLLRHTEDENKNWFKYSQYEFKAKLKFALTRLFKKHYKSETTDGTSCSDL